MNVLKNKNKYTVKDMVNLLKNKIKDFAKYVIEGLKNKIKDSTDYILPNIFYVGLVGMLGFPAYYYVWKYLIVQSYENLGLRLLGMALFVPFVMYQNLSYKLKEWFPAYFLFTCFYSLPFFFSFMLIKNQFSVIWIMSSMAALFLLIIILYDWFLLSAMIALGFTSAYFAAVKGGETVVLANFPLEYLMIYMFALVGGVLFNYRNEMTNRGKLKILRALSGSISHEMRTPLLAIEATDNLIRYQLVDALQKAKKANQKQVTFSQAEISEIISFLENSRHISQRTQILIRMILEQVYDKPVQKDKFLPTSILGTINDAMKEYVFEKDDKSKISVNIDQNDDFVYKGEEDIFVFVLFNLIKNGVYYFETMPENKIEIFVTKSKDFNHLHFKDYGPGVSKKQLKTMFANFKTSGKKGGTGLGLPFCLRVMRNLGGDMICKSELGKGAEFIMTFPICNEKAVKVEKKKADDMPDLKKEVQTQKIEVNKEIQKEAENQEVLKENQIQEMEVQQEIKQEAEIQEEVQKVEVPENKNVDSEVKTADQTQVQTEQNEERKTILVVEDEMMVRRMMEISLKYHNYNVVTAKNGKEALEKLDEHKIDMILMDLQMPEMGGLEATKIIRSGQGFKNFTNHQTIKIIAFTADYGEETLKKIKESGMNNFIDKAINKEKIGGIIKQLLEDESSF